MDCEGKLLERKPARIEVRSKWRSSSESWQHLRLREKGNRLPGKPEELSGKTYLTKAAIFIRWCPKAQRI
jgi:hypothetical protein